MTSTRDRIIQAALELFTAQGVTNTTTRSIADLAEVNEVTLFRHFGNKHGLLLAVLEGSSVFGNLGESLVKYASHTNTVSQALKAYASECLDALERVPELVRSVVGEADRFPPENRRALGQGLTAANRYLAQYLSTVIEQGQIETSLAPEKLAGLLNSLILGYGAIELTSEFHELWKDRADFLDTLVQLFPNGVVSPPQGGALSMRDATTQDVADLPPQLVHDILQKAKKTGHQDYAIAYVLFAAGLSTREVVCLERSQVISDAHQHVLQIEARQVSVNQWVLGKRYGSYVANPLTRWLKTRKDDRTALFLNAEDQPLSIAELGERWQSWTEGCVTPSGKIPSIEQAQQTWCIDMLLRGMSLENLSILTGLDLIQLQPYAQRAKERTAIAQATRLDQKPSQHHS
ncbi:MAG: TetR/AcrR family transcriptional regulator [Acaryochloridaceae cyanobacterium RU_4_10]|nr:TetR/AcrR family transcriptional regulator [Acaryochloridaceae cyanobacterium RU_4_10]